MFTKLHNARIDVSKHINVNMLFRLLADNTFIWNSKTIVFFLHIANSPVVSARELMTDVASHRFTDPSPSASM